jgi:N-acetylmuramoyl-L-alanine amidase
VDLDGQFRYVSVSDVTEALKTHTYYSDKVHKAVIFLDDVKVTLTAFNPFVVVGYDILQMPVETRYHDGDIYVPVKFFLPILKRLLGVANVDVMTGYPPAVGNQANIAAVEVMDKANGTLIRIKTLRPFSEADITTRYSTNWFFVDVYGGRVDTTNLFTQIESGLVRAFRPETIDKSIQLSFHLKKDVRDKEVSVSIHANEVWVTIQTSDELDSDVLDRLKQDREKWRFDRIVIDPGHGGKDPGTKGRDGTREKDVVLAIGKKLKKLLEKNLNAEVVMTRETDKFVTLWERTQAANRIQAKLFISIHANANQNSRIRGIETYFLGLHKTDASLNTAQRENAVIKYENDHSSYAELTEENIILATIAQNSYNLESQDFAAIVQNSMSKRTGLRNRGVKQAGFQVLWGASMPNVLIETGYLSNRTEEKLLRSASFQSKIAEAILESVMSFKKKYESMLRID